MPKLKVLYDADCRLCQAAKKKLEVADKDHQIDLVPLQDPEIQQQYPELAPDKLRQEIHVIMPTGMIKTGMVAYGEIGKVISNRSALGMLFNLYRLWIQIPGMLRVAEWIYSKIAENRYRFTGKKLCQSGHCSIKETND